MPTVDLVKLIALILGISVVGVLGGIMLVVMYPGLKLIVSDIASFLGFLGKWVRKASLATEVEGSVNSFSKRYNSELITPFLPECNVQWVTDANHETVIRPGKVIVKLGFSEDRDLNVYNAATLFVKAGLLTRAKPFLTRTISSAIDLLVVRNLLKASQRTALRVFNDRFNGEAVDCRELFYRLEEIDAGGFFKRVLLQEYYFFGESVGDRVPTPEYQAEAERFLEWLYALVMREGDEKSILQFRGENIRVGVVLIAKEDTYKKYGLTPYLRRANTYASDDFSTIYLVSRGRRRGNITKLIASELVALGCFEQLTKKPEIHTGEGEEGVITCIPMKIDLVGLVQAAWENLSGAYRDNEEITVLVKDVTPDVVTVDALGLIVDLSPNELSSLPISDARRYFAYGQELLVRITEFEQENQWIRVSNVGTASDPQKLIDDFSAKVEENVSAIVTGYSASDRNETGMFVQPEGFEVRGYVPRSKATFSRFAQLSGRYPVGGTVEVRPLTFDVEHATYLCEVVGVSDPWNHVSNYHVDSLCGVTVRQIRERHLTCELEEGIEGTVYFEEVSWDTPEANLVKIRNYKVNDTIQTKILAIDEERKFVRLSIKRTEGTASEKFFVENQGLVLDARISEVRSNGAIVKLGEEGIQGFLPIPEVSYTFCDGLADLLSEGDLISTKVIDYNPYFDNLIVSAKAAKPNDYESFSLAYQVGSEVNARIEVCKKQQIDVVIEFGDSLCVGYVHRSEISNLVFVSEENITDFFKVGRTYPFVVKRFHEKQRVVELSRKELFQNEYMQLEYGVPYLAHIMSQTRGQSIAYSERFEGKIVRGGRNVSGRDAEVILARRGGRPSDVEVEVSK